MRDLDCHPGWKRIVHFSGNLAKPLNCRRFRGFAFAAATAAASQAGYRARFEVVEVFGRPDGHFASWAARIVGGRSIPVPVPIAAAPLPKFVPASCQLPTARRRRPPGHVEIPSNPSTHETVRQPNDFSNRVLLTVQCRIGRELVVGVRFSAANNCLTITVSEGLTRGARQVQFMGPEDRQHCRPYGYQGRDGHASRSRRISFARCHRRTTRSSRRDGPTRSGHWNRRRRT